MRRLRFRTIPTGLLLLSILVIVLLVSSSSAYASSRTENGGDLPYYARIERDEEPIHDGGWAPIVFYRPPECVPDDFNLLDFYHFPDDTSPGAFACQPPTTDGFIIWEGEPWLSNPSLIKLHGLGAVPVWFVSWSDLQVALEDDKLTVPELQAIDSLMIGSANRYNETLHPGVMINYVAKGNLSDGQSFWVHARLVAGDVPYARIVFR